MKLFSYLTLASTLGPFLVSLIQTVWIPVTSSVKLDVESGHSLLPPLPYWSIPLSCHPFTSARAPHWSLSLCSPTMILLDGFQSHTCSAEKHCPRPNLLTVLSVSPAFPDHLFGIVPSHAPTSHLLCSQIIII